MLARIRNEIACCQLHIKECERKAADPNLGKGSRADFRLLARNWRRLAASYETAGEISGYLEWQARRLAPPPD